MKLQEFLIIFCAAFLISPPPALGQNQRASHQVKVEVPEVALLGLIAEGDQPITLETAAPLQAGTRVDLSEIQHHQGIWLNYTSIIGNQTHRRSVVAAVQGNIPQGLHLIVEAMEATGEGRGRLGTPAGRIDLSEVPTEVISDIGSCFTGKGINKGHLLTYHLQTEKAVDKIPSLEESPIVLHVTYTLTDHN